MDEEFEIEIQSGPQVSKGSIQLPVNFLTVGEIEHDDVKVYIKQDVYSSLEKYSAEDVTRERGTILFGEYCEEMGKTYVLISGFIEAKYTDSSEVTLKFTHETWNYISREHDKQYPEKRIVGWQHTHPNLGVFLSGYDLFIQEYFFNLPFQVAYVIDPVRKLRGFFQWKNGKIEQLKGYCIYDDIGKPVSNRQIRHSAASPDKRKKVAALISIIAAIVIAVGSIVTAYVLDRAKDKKPDIQTDTGQTALIQEEGMESC